MKGSSVKRKVTMRVALLLALVVCAGTGAWAADYANTYQKSFDWLAGQQAADGSFGAKDVVKVGVTGLLLQAWAAAPDAVREANASFLPKMQKAADWLAGQQQSDGSLCVSPENQNYSTSISVQALAGFDRQKYAPVIAKAVVYLKSLQATAARKFDKTKHNTYGGFGYGSSLRPDLSNTWFALGALKSGGVPDNDPVWADAVVFIKRCQNSSEVSDQKFAGEDGGAMYLPGDSPAGKEKDAAGKEIFKSMGSMTAAMLCSYLWCGEAPTEKPTELAAKWLEKNFNVKANTGHQKEGQMALYYYYRALAMALTAYGKEEFGGHKWKSELGAEIVRLQKPEGFWLNEVARFSENDPLVCTGYALHVLGLCARGEKPGK